MQNRSNGGIQPRACCGVGDSPTVGAFGGMDEQSGRQADNTGLDCLDGTPLLDLKLLAPYLGELEAELGVGWRGPCNRLQLTAGYMVSAWCNAVETDEWIQTVQNNSFVDLGDTPVGRRRGRRVGFAAGQQHARERDGAGAGDE